ncbi:MAG: hypothetical protein ACFCAD_12465 [Pleurocapsa sp.]
MSGKTTYLTTSDFTEQVTLSPSNFECSINNSNFRKGDSLRHEKIKEVLDICKKYHKLNINTLVVKDTELLTIWIEEKSYKASTQNSESQTKTPANNQSLPTKTITRRYRGQVYEETVVDWSAMQQVNQQNKPSRKYRGQYVD